MRFEEERDIHSPPSARPRYFFGSCVWYMRAASRLSLLLVVLTDAFPLVCCLVCVCAVCGGCNLVMSGTDIRTYILLVDWW